MKELLPVGLLYRQHSSGFRNCYTCLCTFYTNQLPDEQLFRNLVLDTLSLPAAGITRTEYGILVLPNLKKSTNDERNR
jgi:hypothetical protein